MTLNLTPLEELESAQESQEQRRASVPQLDVDILAANPIVPEDIEDQSEVDQTPSVRPEQFLGGAELPPTALEARRTRIEDSIGESVRVQGRNAEIVAAIRDGVITKVSVGFWRARVQNKASDLGLDEAVARKLFSGFGVRLLAPKEIINRLNSIDTQARTLLSRFGLTTPWGRFIPRRNWSRFKSAFDALQAEFNDTIRALANQAESGELAEWVRRSYEEFAHASWPKVRDTWTPDIDPVFEINWAEVVEPPEQYVNALVTNALAKLPSPGYIMDAAKFGYDLSIVQAPDTVLAHEYVTEDDDLRRELLQQMNDRKASLIDDFLRTARETLLENIQGLVESVTHTLQGKAAVHGKTINKILGKLEDVRMLNVCNDVEFEQRINELEQFVLEKKTSKSRSTHIDPQVILRQLNRTASEITGSLNRQLQNTQQFSSIGEF